MPEQVFDVNTTTVADGATGPGEMYQPLRYVTEDDAVRVSVWQDLSTILGTDALDTTKGLDVEDIFDTGTSDKERAAAVQRVVENNAGVAAVTEEPVVTTSDDGQTKAIAVTARTIYGGEFSLGVSV